MRSVISFASLIVVSVALTTVTFDGQQTGQKTVRMHALSPGDTLYVLMDGGGHSIALADEVSGGVVLIDTKVAGWGQAIIDTLLYVTDLPITTIVNTHAHQDHIGSNGEFPGPVQIIAHENAKVSMQKMETFQGDNAGGLPDTTYTDTLSLLEGPNRIELYHFGAAHTAGDTIIVFPEKGVAHMGDLFINKAVPFIDPENGGSGVSYPETLAKVFAGIEGVEKVITGHSALPAIPGVQGMLQTLTWEDVGEYAEFNRDFLEAVEQAFEEGRNVEQAVATLSLPARYADYDMERAGVNVRVIYDELRKRADASEFPARVAVTNIERKPLLTPPSF